jgi:predicted DNA-binding ribbon-helix-helix protein
MKNNLEAKFYDDILKAAKQEIPTIERLEFEIDNNIENPSNKDSIDCAKFYKEASKKTKTTTQKTSQKTNS